MVTEKKIPEVNIRRPMTMVAGSDWAICSSKNVICVDWTVLGSGFYIQQKLQ